MKKRIFNVIMTCIICCAFAACNKTPYTEKTSSVNISNPSITIDSTTVPENIEITFNETTIAEEIVEKPEFIYVTTNDNLNFRRESNTDSDIICVIPSETKVKLLDFNKEEDFYLCEFEGVKGYLFKDYIDVTKEKLVAKEACSIHVKAKLKEIKKGEVIEIYKVNNGYITEDFEDITAIAFDNFITYSKYLESIIEDAEIELLTSFSTSFSKGNNRAYNIALAASEIDSVVIAKGENFNWHEIVGNTSKDEGYLLAGVYYNGQSTEGYGGGVCQVSSTLYNCVLNTNMQVVERHRHSKAVSYVDYAAGKDAAVGDIGSQNLIFKNNTDSDIVIKAYVTDDTSNLNLEIITVEFYKIIV